MKKTKKEKSRIGKKGINVLDTKNLLKFLNLVGMSGDAEVKECILDFNEEGISLQAETAFESVVVRGTYLPEGNWYPMGELGIDNLADLRKYLGSFDDEEVEVSVEKNYLLLKGNKRVVKVQLRDIEYLLPNQPEDKKVSKLIEMGKKNTFALEPWNVEKIVNNSNLMDIREFNLELNKKTLKYSATSWNQHKIKETLEVNSKSKGITLTLPKYFVNVISTINDGVKLGLNEDAPIYVGYKNKKDNLEVEWAIAPVIAKEESKE